MDSQPIDFMFSGGVCNHRIIYEEVESHFVQGTLPQNVLPVITSEDVASSLYKVNIGDMEPLVKDFASRWNSAIELVHKDVTMWRSWKRPSRRCFCSTPGLSSASRRSMVALPCPRIWFPYPIMYEIKNTLGPFSYFLPGIPHRNPPIS